MLDAGADPKRTNRETRRQRRSWRARNDFRLDDIAERESTPGDRLPNTPLHLTAPRGAIVDAGVPQVSAHVRRNS